MLREARFRRERPKGPGRPWSERHLNHRGLPVTTCRGRCQTWSKRARAQTSSPTCPCPPGVPVTSKPVLRSYSRSCGSSTPAWDRLTSESPLASHEPALLATRCTIIPGSVPGHLRIWRSSPCATNLTCCAGLRPSAPRSVWRTSACGSGSPESGLTGIRRSSSSSRRR